MNLIYGYFVIGLFFTVLHFSCMRVFGGKSNSHLYQSIYVVVWAVFLLFWPVFVLTTMVVCIAGLMGKDK